MTTKTCARKKLNRIVGISFESGCIKLEDLAEGNLFGDEVITDAKRNEDEGAVVFETAGRLRGGVYLRSYQFRTGETDFIVQIPYGGDGAMEQKAIDVDGEYANMLREAGL